MDNDSYPPGEHIETDLGWQGAMEMNARAEQLSHEQRLWNAKFATSIEILAAFRDQVIATWNITETQIVMDREARAAAGHLRYAQWLRSTPTAEEIAEAMS